MMKLENEDSCNDKYFRGRSKTDKDCRLAIKDSTLKTPSTSEGEFVGALRLSTTSCIESSARYVRLGRVDRENRCLYS